MSAYCCICWIFIHIKNFSVQIWDVRIRWNLRRRFYLSYRNLVDSCYSLYKIKSTMHCANKREKQFALPCTFKHSCSRLRTEGSMLCPNATIIWYCTEYGDSSAGNWELGNMVYRTHCIYWKSFLGMFRNGLWKFASIAPTPPRFFVVRNIRHTHTYVYKGKR